MTTSPNTPPAEAPATAAAPFLRFALAELRRTRISRDALLALLATPPSLAAFGSILLLMRVVPDATALREELASREEAGGEPAPPGRVRAPRVHPAMKVLAALYRRSLLYSFLHRDGSPCLFVPSCTDYTVRAVSKHGIRRGLLLAGDRFRRCNGAYRGPYVDFP